MFRPNNRCRIQIASGKTDVRGNPLPGRFVTEGCSVVKLELSTEKSSVRADSSASRGNAHEMQALSVLLLTTKTAAKIGDIIEIEGVQLRIQLRHPRFDSGGRLDHYEIHATMWSQT